MISRVIRTETRVRSGWNKLWIFLLVAFNVLMAVEAFALAYRVGELRRTTTGLGQLALNSIAGQRMQEVLMLWVAGTMLLGIAVWLTRPTAVVVETSEERSVPPPLPPPRTQPSSGWRVIAFLLLFVVYVPIAARIAAAVVPARSDWHVPVAIGLCLAGGFAIYQFVSRVRLKTRGGAT